VCVCVCVCVRVCVRACISVCVCVYNSEDIHNKVHRFVTKYKNITDTIISYEQAGLSEETLGKGLHVHIIFKHTYKKLSKLSVDIISNFKSLHPGAEKKM